jgi:hypothetical protein
VDDTKEDQWERLKRITGDIQLGMNCSIRLGAGRAENEFYVQIKCWREDTITGEMGFGFGGKAWPSVHASDSEIVQMIFGLYKSYWEHEARETFVWRGRRPFGPHISTEALWEVARRVDVRSAHHVEDKANA